MVAEWSNVRPESRSPKWLVFVLCDRDLSLLAVCRDVKMPSNWQLSDCLIYCTNTYTNGRGDLRGCSDVSSSSSVTSQPVTSSFYCCNDTIRGFICCTDVTRAVTSSPSQLTSTLCTTTLKSPTSVSFWWMWVTQASASFSLLSSRVE